MRPVVTWKSTDGGADADEAGTVAGALRGEAVAGGAALEEELATLLDLGLGGLRRRRLRGVRDGGVPDAGRHEGREEDDEAGGPVPSY